MKISDYGIIGDGRSTALVSRLGAIDWLCLPDPDSPPVFAGLLDRMQGGSYAISVENLTEATRRYLPGTAILETLLKSSDGAVRILDCMPIFNQRHENTLSPEREVLRRIECVSGSPTVNVRLHAVEGFTGRPLAFDARGRLGWSARHGKAGVYFTSDIEFQREDHYLSTTIKLRQGVIHYLSLSYHPQMVAVIPPLGEYAWMRLEGTRQWWEEWSKNIEYSGPYTEAVMRSAITLRLLTFPLSGALIAAPTTSLPEVPGGEMNWDYRYCWLRDAAWAAVAFVHIGLDDEARAFFAWLMLAGKMTAPELNVMYDVYGRADVTESLHYNWAGYEGAQPVRTGNALMNQRQLDVYGEVLHAIQSMLHETDETLEHNERKLIEGFGRVICDQWRAPDNGIWEIRGARKHYTYSKAQAWFVLDCLLKLHGEDVVKIPVEEFRRHRDSIRQAIDSEGVDASGGYTGIFNQEHLDAAVLLLPSIGYTTADDPRMLRFWQRINDELGENGLIHRFSAGFAGHGMQEGAFIISSFWGVDYLVRLGKVEEATERFEKVLSYANDLLLMSEEANPATGELMGNFPQTFSHTGLINAAAALERARTR